MGQIDDGAAMPPALERALAALLAALVFYLVLTPLAAAGRALGWDPLRLRRTSADESQWRARPDRRG